MADEQKQAGGTPDRTVVTTAEPPSGATGNGHGDGPGTFADVASGFVSTAKQWTTDRADPLVAASFLLGWRVGLALSWAAEGKRTPWPDDDPGLDEEERWRVLKGQIESTAHNLTAGHAMPGAEDRPGLPEDAPHHSDPTEADTALRAIVAVRRDLLRRLYVQDHFRGMAFTLGGQLEALCIGADPDEFLRGIPDVSKPLLALATSLPPNAAHSVLNSLALWSEQLKEHKRAFKPEHLLKQGGIWRSILAGDVAARDLLHLSDYVGTAEQVVASLHEFALKALRRHLLIPAVLVVAFLAGGILLMLLDDNAAGVTSVIAAFGLSWKGIGQYLGKAAAEGEQALWNGQMDWTIAYRATISLRKPSSVPKRERARAECARMLRAGHAADRRRKSHYYIWQKWLRNWPDFELDR